MENLTLKFVLAIMWALSLRCGPMRSGTKTAQLKARCENELKARLVVIAADLRVDLSDIIRIACYDYAHRVTSCQTISMKLSESASPKT